MAIAAMESFGVGEKSAYECWRVCYYVEHSARAECSTFQHHKMALRETGGDVKRAMRWVQRAADEGLSVADMRAGIRQEGIEGGSPDPDPDRETQCGTLHTCATTLSRLVD